MPDYYDRTNIVNAPDPSKWRQFGDYIIDELILFGPNKLSIDIKNQTGLIKLVISESLYQNFMYGEIKFLDFSNLTDRLELNGQDFIQVSFTTPGFSGKMIKKKFYVTNFNQLKLSHNAKGKEVTLGFISSDGYNSMQNTVVGCYKGTITEMISQINQSYLKNELIHANPTVNSHSFIIPHWSPHKTINWLAKKSVSATNTDDCSFLFYEDFDGNHFTTLHHLAEQEVMADYDYFESSMLPYSSTISTNSSIENKMIRHFHNIKDLQFKRHFDKVKEIDNGVYASNMVSLDMISKDWSYSQFDYLDHFDKTDSVEKYPLIPRETNLNVNKNINSNFNFVGTHMFSHEGIEDNFRYSDYLLKRRSSVLRTRSTSMSIIVSGDSTRRVGDVVNIVIPKMEPLEEQSPDPVDRALSGRYLVTGLQHVINKDDGYTTRLEVSRDSLPFELMNAEN